MHAVAPPPLDPLTQPAPWSAVAADYDDVWFGRLPALTDHAIESLKLEKGDRVLDVAAGPGTLAVRLAPRVGHVVAIDFAEGMIERLRGHLMRSRLANLEVRLMDGEDLAFDDSSFDAAISLFGWYLFDDRARGLSEMFRVIVPGGRVLLSSWGPLEQNTLLGAGAVALREAFPDLPQHPELDGSAPSEVLQGELEAAGFEQVSSRSFEQSVRFESILDYWRDFERTSAAVSWLEQQLAPDVYARAAARASEVLLATWGSAPVELCGSAVFISGERPLSAA
jgi:SAM-dependent methyltransferase